MALRHDGVRNILIPVVDPDLQIRGGVGHPDPEIRGGRAPWALPLDPPLHTSLIGKVGTNVEVEPQLQPLDNERFQRFNLRSAVTSRRQDWT